MRELQFDEKPDYQYIKDLFKKLLMKNELYNDFNFDWVLRQKEETYLNYNNDAGIFSKLTNEKDDLLGNNRRSSGISDVLNVAKRLSGVSLREDK